MDVDKSEESASALSFTDNISIAWSKIDYQPDEAHLALVNESNESFLRAVSAISEFSKETSDSSNPALSQELARLDLKLNLLLDLVGQLIYSQLDIPDISRVTVSSAQVDWQDGSVPEPGSIVFVQVYIQRGTPKPLCFYGEVVSSPDDYRRGWARVRYLGLSESVQVWLDKLIVKILTMHDPPLESLALSNKTIELLLWSDGSMIDPHSVGAFDVSQFSNRTLNPAITKVHY